MKSSRELGSMVFLATQYRNDCYFQLAYYNVGGFRCALLGLVIGSPVLALVPGPGAKMKKFQWPIKIELIRFSSNKLGH